jgi:hypothetical protein
LKEGRSLRMSRSTDRESLTSNMAMINLFMNLWPKMISSNMIYLELLRPKLKVFRMVFNWDSQICCWALIRYLPTMSIRQPNQAGRTQLLKKIKKFKFLKGRKILKRLLLIKRITPKLCSLISSWELDFRLKLKKLTTFQCSRRQCHKSLMLLLETNRLIPIQLIWRLK